MRSLDFILKNHKGIARLAATGFLTLITALLLVLTESLIHFDSEVDLIIGLLLGLVLVSGVTVMLATTYIAFTRRHYLNDWRKFLLITWLIPYIGSLFMLGLPWCLEWRKIRAR